MTAVIGEQALNEFRGGLTGCRGLDLLNQNGGRLLVQLPVGVGKSRWIDAITLEALGGGDYDLVVVLSPTRQLINERAPLRSPPPGARVVNLRPRPSRKCGPDRDAAWKKYEAAGLGALGRVEVCGPCPLRGKCFWPGQYGRGLKGARLVYATQAHLERSRGFLASLRAWAGAERPLTLLDEISFLGKSFEGVVRADDLGRFLRALRLSAGGAGVPPLRHRAWVRLVEALQGASTRDLQAGDWRPPPMGHRWAAAVQRAGLRRFGADFRYLGHALAEFGHSPVGSRLRDAAGDVRYSARPYVGDCLVFSGTADPALARYRLGKDLASPFAGHRFAHPGTRWYNLASPAGTRQYFARHAPQALDFFAALVARRASEGKRVLLVAKKCFVELCAAGLNERLRPHGLEVVTGGWSEQRLAAPGVVPLINYGLIGTNLFEGFDAAYCLTGYYVHGGAVNACLQDLTRRDLRLPIKVETAGSPLRRRASAADPDDRYHDVARLAQPALELQEHAAVVQAVGRVRPFTRPREVVTFQMAELPGVAYDAEFRTLAEARRHFGVPTRRASRAADLAGRVRALRLRGLTQAEAAAELGVSTRTVRRHERGPAGPP